jgi:HEAT repeat protein
MKRLNSIFENAMLIFIMVVFFMVTNSSAQSNSINEITKNKYALDNLIAGIKSENCGIKRSAIYFAGKYRIEEVKDVLLEQLNSENEACLRILIALVLYELGEPKGLLAVKNFTETDEDLKSRRMATQIYYNFLKHDN